MTRDDSDPMDATGIGAGHRSPPSGRRCRATSKRSGERCRRLAIPGGAVCVMHGGAAPQVAAAAQRRLSSAALYDALPRILGPEVLSRVAARPESGQADVTNAFERLSRARQRQPRWWRAVEEHNDRAYSKALAHAMLKLMTDDAWWEAAKEAALASARSTPAPVE